MAAPLTKLICFVHQTMSKTIWSWRNHSHGQTDQSASVSSNQTADNPINFQIWKFFMLTGVSSFGLQIWLMLSGTVRGVVSETDTWLPLIYVLGITLISRSVFPIPPLWLKVGLTVAASALNIRYLYWRITSTLVLDWYSGPICLAVLLMELIAILNVTFISYQTLKRTNHTPEVDRLSVAVQNGDYQPSVDILVPTYNEPLDVLERTLTGCLAMHYDNKKVWLLDDGKRPEAAVLAERLGCQYLTRPDGAHAKAGNLNNGLKYATGEIVVVFDADFIPLNHFLQRTIPLFQKPEVAMVVTPQNFYNPDPPQLNLGGDILPHEQTTFYSIIQSGRDFTNSCICTGTSTVIRRAHLDEIGGVPTGTIVEDWITGFKLQARGYRTIYLNEMLSLGAAPENLGAYLVQRIRWGEGTLKTFFGKDNPLNLPGLTLIQRLNHASGALYWIDQATQSVGYIAPVLFILLGMRAMNVQVPEIIYYWLPNYVAGLICISWVVGSRTVLVSYVYNALQCFHLVPMVVNTLLRPNAKVKFKVTPKGVTQNHASIDFRLMAPVLLLFSINFILFAFSLLAPGWLGYTGQSHVINVLWTGWNSMVLGLTILAGIDPPVEQRAAERIPCSDEFELIWIDGEKQVEARSHLVDLSELGAALPLSIAKPLQIGQVLTLSIPAAPLKLAAEVVRIKDVIGCQFLDPIAHRQSLIEFIYCRPHHWKVPMVAHEGKALQSLIVSLFDLYPLRRFG
jgi:cellulose synthase (UDP-forming)